MAILWHSREGKKLAEEKEKRKVTVEDALAVLVKHANVSGDPDDQETLALYIEQEEEAKQQQQEKTDKPAVTTSGKGPK